MKIDYNIASFIIRVEADEAISLAPGERFASFADHSGNAPDLILSVRKSLFVIPGESERVFDAPLYEEDDDGARRSSEPFWTVYHGSGGIYIRVILKEQPHESVLHIPPSGMQWYFYTSEHDGVVDPLPYPVDGLLLYYLVSYRGGVMIHGSGVVSDGRGWLFSGSSGKGKTTLAAIFDRCGDRVIHDDRLVLLRGSKGWMMYNTPVYSDEEPRSSLVEHIWIISHGSSNVSVPVEGARAVALVLSNCIQQNWNSIVTEKTVAAVEALVAETAVSRLQFVPGKSVRDYLLRHREEKTDVIASAAAEMLSGGREIIAYAGGYSMWPSIKPGDRVIVSPLQPSALEKGDIVALSRDGGFVAHRITALTDSDGQWLIKTRGDACMQEDQWSGISEIKGVVREIIRSGQKKRIRERKMPYLLNRLGALLSGKILFPLTGRGRH